MSLQSRRLKSQTNKPPPAPSSSSDSTSRSPPPPEKWNEEEIENPEFAAEVVRFQDVFRSVGLPIGGGLIEGPNSRGPANRG